MRTGSIFAISALALGFIHSHALAQSSPPPTPRPTQGEIEQARNTYIFQFSDSVGRGQMPARAQQIVARAGGNLLHVYTNVVGGFAARLPGAALWNVAGERDVISYQRDEIVTIAGNHWCDIGHWKCESGAQPEPDPEPEPAPSELTCGVSGTEPWGVTRINAPSPDNCGLGVHVYVIDTGIDLDHASLTPVGTSVDCTKGPSCIQGGNGDDDHGHGTHVAGTIGGRGPDVVGVAPGVYLHSVKVLKSNGIGFRSDIIAGIDWVATQVQNGKPVVANLSLGGTGSKSGTCLPTGWTGSDAYHRAFCEAARKGVVFVVAAGNSGADAEKFAPAAYHDAVITVSATQEGDDWPSWSNWGDEGAPWAPTNSAPVAIAAPGVGILSTKMGGGTTTMSGTSMASPHVAGIAALLLEGDGYAATYDGAFKKVRDAILAKAAASFTTEGDNPHDEKFGCAVTGC